MRYLSEGLSVPFARLLGEEHQLLVLLLPLVDVEEAGQQAHQQHEGYEAQHGEDGHGQRRQLVGWRAKQGSQSVLTSRSRPGPAVRSHPPRADCLQESLGGFTGDARPC